MSPGGASGTLTDLVVQFVAKGLDDIKAAINALQSAVADASAKVGAAATAMNASFAGVGSGVNALSQSAIVAFGKVVQAISPATTALAAIGKSAVAGVAVLTQALAPVRSALAPLAAAASSAFGSVATAISPVTNAIVGMGGAVGSAMSAIVQKLSPIQGALATLGSAAASGMAVLGRELAKDAAQLAALGKSAVAAVSAILGAIAPVASAVAAIGRVGGAAFGMLAASLAPVQKKLEEVQAKAEAMASVIQRSLGLATAAVLGFAGAGIRMSVIGMRMSYDMERLSLSIGGLFAPAIENVLSLVERFTDWLNSLSEAQRANAARWLLLGTAIVGVASVGPKVISMVSAVVTAFRVGCMAINAALVSTGVGAILPIVGALLAAAGAVTYLSEGWEGLADIFEAFEPIVDMVKEAFAEFQPIFRGIASAVAGFVHAITPLLKILIQIGTWIAKIQLGIAYLASGLWLFKGLDPGARGHKAGSAHGPLAKTAGSIGGVEDAYYRIAKASSAITGGKRVDEQQLDELRHIRQATEKTNLELGQFDGAVKRNK